MSKSVLQSQALNGSVPLKATMTVSGSVMLSRNMKACVVSPSYLSVNLLLIINQMHVKVSINILMVISCLTIPKAKRAQQFHLQNIQCPKIKSNLHFHSFRNQDSEINLMQYLPYIFDYEFDVLVVLVG